MDNNLRSDNLNLNSLPKKTFEITVKVLFSDIEKARNSVIAVEKEKIEIKGFRKGHAPEKMVREEIGEKKLLELTLDKILSDLYKNAVTHFNIKPVVGPKVELVSAKEGEDWEIKFVTCEEPEVVLGNYKEELKKAKPAPKIWTPDEKAAKKDEEGKEDERGKKINAYLDWFINNTKLEIGDLLVEDEINHKLSSLLDQIQKLGLTLDQYLASTGKKPEDIKESYKIEAERTLKMEFILGKIAEEEKISVSPEEIEKAISSAPTEVDKKALENQKYFLAVLLRRQKTLDFLAQI